ncbi:MAG: long-chain fatty acid--CoA ligase, partial [Burkholderiales bacterium]
MSVLWDLSRIRPKHEVIVAGETLPALFRNAAERRGDSVFLREKELGLWRSWSWTEVGRAVREVSMGLASLGFERGECASILSNTVVEWVLADLAILCAGGVSNGIYPTDPASQVQYVCEDSRSVIVFVEDEEQLDKLLEVRDRLPLLRWIVVFDTEGLKHYHDPMVVSLAEIRERGARYDAEHPGDYDARCEAAKPEELAILIYTSGTTGRPKGAMLSHRNVIYTVRGYNLLISQEEEDERICFLPLCHVAERLGGEYFAVYSGARLNFVESPDTVPENVREIAPTVFLAVPRVWEKFYSAVSIASAEASRLQQVVYR